jgi:hypothetical protein
MTMTLKETLAQLEALGNEKVRAHNSKREYPVSKGCTSPFAPIWIKEMVSRQG